MDKGNTSKSDDDKSANTECTICLQMFVQPVKLPCNHIFCFLCAKGLTRQNNKCALCRKEIPNNYINRPKFVVQRPSGSDSASYQWYYQGQSGWWQYDDQTSGQIEHAYQNDKEQCEVLIAGEIYVIDFEKNKQILKSNPIRSRHIKRDLDTSTCKGVAGVPTSLFSKATFQKTDDTLKTASPAKSSDSSDCIITISKKNVSELHVNVDTCKHQDMAIPSSSNLSSCVSGNSSTATDGKTLKETQAVMAISDNSDSENEELSDTEVSDDNNEEISNYELSDDKTSDMSLYEKMVEKKRAEGIAFLQSLKIAEVKEDLSKLVNTIQKKPCTKTANRKKEECQPLPKRKSKRLSNTAVDYSQKRLCKRSEQVTEQNENEDARVNLPLSTNIKKCNNFECIQRRLESSFGATMMSKLQEMTQIQRLYAEKIINDTLFNGLLGKLTENSCITDSSVLTSGFLTESSIADDQNIS